MSNGKSKVRYIRLNVMALEIIQLQPESVKAQFMDILMDCFRKLEAGEPIKQIQIDDNPYLNLILQEEIPELIEGYSLFKRLSSGQRGKPEVDQSLTRGQPEVNSKEKVKREEKENDIRLLTVNPQGIDPEQEQEISERLKALGSIPDKGFWNTCKRYGYIAVDMALNKAESVGSNDIKWITGMIANGVE